MKKLVLFMHISLDGFVAGTNGEMDWIKVNEEIFDYVAQSINETDTALYGRVTFEMMESYWPTAAQQPNASKHDIEHSIWYKAVSKFVISKSWQNKNISNAKVISDNLSENILSLKSQARKDIIMFGSPSAAQSLMKLNLIDEYWLFVNPIILGKGMPLFSGSNNITQLKLKESTAFSSGVICLHYENLHN
ncbi:MAG TPA: dihydrofolate reductase family protein [Arachidicoccus soli]|nr:dihydrofolate reductase family protein [Arachidicoccus soli]